MENEKQILAEFYELLSEFLKISGYSKRKFALEAGFEPRTFYNMIDRKSKLRVESAARIKVEMRHIIREFRHKEEYEIHTQLENINYKTIQIISRLGLITEEYSDLYDSIEKQIEKKVKKARETGKSSSYESIIDQFIKQYPGTIIAEGKEAEFLMEDDSPRSRLLDAFDQLNEKGQETAADRVQELTQIESYRKKED